jgi:membrane fusion protein (multidrug efflux system)
MRIEVDVPNPELTIYPGMFARVELGVERHPNVLVIPRKAVTVQHDRFFVFVNLGGTARKVSVTVGTDDGDWCEASSGLTGEESIIVPEGRALIDGMAVLPAEGT